MYLFFYKKNEDLKQRLRQKQEQFKFKRMTKYAIADKKGQKILLRVKIDKKQEENKRLEEKVEKKVENTKRVNTEMEEKWGGMEEK